MPIAAFTTPPTPPQLQRARARPLHAAHPKTLAIIAKPVTHRCAGGSLTMGAIMWWRVSPETARPALIRRDARRFCPPRRSRRTRKTNQPHVAGVTGPCAEGSAAAAGSTSARNNIFCEPRQTQPAQAAGPRGLSNPDSRRRRAAGMIVSRTLQIVHRGHASFQARRERPRRRRHVAGRTAKRTGGTAASVVIIQGRSEDAHDGPEDLLWAMRAVVGLRGHQMSGAPRRSCVCSMAWSFHAIDANLTLLVDSTRVGVLKQWAGRTTCPV